MFSFLKKSKAKTVPAWAASFFSADEYDVFITELEAMLKKRNLNYSIGDGVVYLSGSNAIFEQLGLINLAQTCKLSAPSSWESLINTHFHEMEQISDFTKLFEVKSRDFEYAKDFLAIRLFNGDVLNDVQKDIFVKRAFAGDAFTMLSFDLPQSVINVKPEQMQNWNKSQDELFEIGKRNVEKKYNFDFSRETINDFDIWFIQDEHHFVPNFVFSLDKYPALNGEFGSLIGVPHRHAAIIYPIETTEAIEAVNSLPFIISGMFKEGPGSVSNHLYWYHKGVFQSLPFELGENKLVFKPGLEFLDILQQLPAKDA
ncbi:MAG: hypothetical protein J7578_01905 [Chitinophagaceae bacterium]|nr:hypothetical protein [Chitinophagaceae bacterium]